MPWKRFRKTTKRYPGQNPLPRNIHEIQALAKAESSLLFARPGFVRKHPTKGTYPFFRAMSAFVILDSRTRSTFKFSYIDCILSCCSLRIHFIAPVAFPVDFFYIEILSIYGGSLADNILPFILLFTAGTKHYSFSLLCTDGASTRSTISYLDNLLAAHFGNNLLLLLAFPTNFVSSASSPSSSSLFVSIHLQAQDVYLACSSMAGTKLL